MTSTHRATNVVYWLSLRLERKSPSFSLSLSLSPSLSLSHTHTHEHAHAHICISLSSCIHCKQLEPVWNEIASVFQDDPRVKIGEVNCLENPGLCQAKGIRGYPTIVEYKGSHKVCWFESGCAHLLGKV